MRKIDARVLRAHPLHHAAQALEERDHRPVEAPVVQQAPNMQVAAPVSLVRRLRGRRGQLLDAREEEQRLPPGRVDLGPLNL